MSKEANNESLTPGQMQDGWRLAISYMRAVRAQDTALAGDILNQFDSPIHALWSVSTLAGYVFDRVEGIDDRLEELSNEAATESGDWPV